MPIKNPGTVLDLLKRAKAAYQRTPALPAGKPEKRHKDIVKDLGRLKVMAKKKAEGADVAVPFAGRKKLLLKKMTDHRKALNREKEADPNKAQLPTYVKALRKFQMALVNLDYSTATTAPEAASIDELEEGDASVLDAMDTISAEEMLALEAADSAELPEEDDALPVAPPRPAVPPRPAAPPRPEPPSRPAPPTPWVEATPRGRGEGVVATPAPLLTPRLLEVGRKIAAIDADAGPRVAPLKAELAALGPLATNPATRAAAADRLTALEGRVAALEPVIAREREARRVAVERSTAANLAVNEFKAGRLPVSPAVREQSAVAQRAIAGELTTLKTNKDLIKLRGVILDSSDKDYHRDVTTPVTALLAKVGRVLADPKLVTLAMADELDAMRLTLETPRKHYLNTAGITDQAKLDQRDRKVKAIAGHMDQLSGMADTLRALIKARTAPVQSALDALPALAADAPGSLAGPATNVGALLVADAETRSVVIENADAASAGGLVAAFNTTGGKVKEMIQDVIAARGDDPAFLVSMATTAIRQEASMQIKSGANEVNMRTSFFRTNTVGATMPMQVIEASKEGGAFLKATKGRMFTRIESSEADCEMDPNKLKGTPEEKAAAQALAKAANFAAVKGLVDDFAAQAAEVPDVVAKMTDEYYQQALLMSGGDEEYAVTQAGGFLMLRMVNPMLAADFVTEKAETIKNGSEAEKAKVKKQARAATLQSKVLMNMSSGLEFGAKEPFMHGMNELIKTPDGQPTPEMVKLRGALKAVARRGAAAKMPKPALDAVLANPAAVAAFRVACVRQHGLENLEFYLAAQAKPTGAAAQAVFDKYISSASPTAVNVAGADFAGFNAINSKPEPKPWGDAPWGSASLQVKINLRDVLTNAKPEMTNINAALMG